MKLIDRGWATTKRDWMLRAAFIDWETLMSTRVAACRALKHVNMCTQAAPPPPLWNSDSELVVSRGATPRCLFDRQLNRISRNNGALNLLRVPRRVPERGGGVRGRRFSLIYVGKAGASPWPCFHRPVCQPVIEEQQGMGPCPSQWISNDLLGSLTPVHYT